MEFYSQTTIVLNVYTKTYRTIYECLIELYRPFMDWTQLKYMPHI